MALIKTFGGSGSSKAHPIHHSLNLTARDEEEILCRQIIVEGIMAIQSGENPKFSERSMTRAEPKPEGGESRQTREKEQRQSGEISRGLFRQYPR